MISERDAVQAALRTNLYLFVRKAFTRSIRVRLFFRAGT